DRALPHRPGAAAGHDPSCGWASRPDGRRPAHVGVAEAMGPRLQDRGDQMGQGEKEPEGEEAEGEGGSHQLDDHPLIGCHVRREGGPHLLPLKPCLRGLSTTCSTRENNGEMECAAWRRTVMIPRSTLCAAATCCH